MVQKQHLEKIPRASKDINGNSANKDRLKTYIQTEHSVNIGRDWEGLGG